MTNLNALRWDGRPGCYEVYYLSTTDPQTGIGLWIRYTILASATNAPATCSLWFMAMDATGEVRFGRKISYPIAQLRAQSDPFILELADATLTDRGMAGGFEDVAW